MNEPDGTLDSDSDEEMGDVGENQNSENDDDDDLMGSQFEWMKEFDLTNEADLDQQ